MLVNLCIFGVSQHHLRNLINHNYSCRDDECVHLFFQYIDPLPALLIKEELTDEEVVQCKQVIYNLVTLETKNESLQSPNTGQRGKGPKRYVLFLQYFM